MSLTSCHCSTPRRLMSRPISPILSRTAIYLGLQVTLRLFAAYLGLSEQPHRPALGLAPGRGYPFHSGRHRLSPRRPALVSVALFLASRRTGVTRYPALWSGDFPHVDHTMHMIAARLSSLLSICQYSTAYRGTQPQSVPQLVDLDLIALQDCISCHSERSGEPEFEESRNPRTLDSSSRSLS